jgi:hypothetical protein
VGGALWFSHLLYFPLSPLRRPSLCLLSPTSLPVSLHLLLHRLPPPLPPRLPSPLHLPRRLRYQIPTNSSLPR